MSDDKLYIHVEISGDEWCGEVELVHRQDYYGLNEAGESIVVDYYYLELTRAQYKAIRDYMDGHGLSGIWKLVKKRMDSASGDFRKLKSLSPLEWLRRWWRS